MVIWRYTKTGILDGISKHIKINSQTDEDDEGKAIVFAPNVNATGYSKNSFGKENMVIWEYDVK